MSVQIPIKRRIRFRAIAGKSKIPYLTIDRKLGRVYLNKKAIDLTSIGKGDILNIFEMESELYLKKTQDEADGFRVYSWGNNGKTLSFASKDTVQFLFEKMKINGNAQHIRLQVANTSQEGVFYLTLMK